MHRRVKATSGNRDGMALVLTLLAVSFMVAITVQLFSSVNWQMQASVNLRDSVMLDAMNRSGLSLARAALLADQRENKFDSLHDSWNVLDSNRLGTLMGRGRLQVAVTDFSGLLQVNALLSSNKDPKKKKKYEDLQKELWIRFLTSGKFVIEDSEEAEELIAAIRDWIDENDDEDGDKGAESGYYRSLSPSYSPRNGPVQYLEELLLIRGMTPELFYGNEDKAGVKDFVSVVGQDGKVNINSAPLEILEALHEDIDREMAQGLIDFREEEENKGTLSASGWYKQVSGIPGDVKIEPDIIDVVSRYFKVSSTAENNGVTRIGSGVIFREDDETQRLVSWEVR